MTTLTALAAHAASLWLLLAVGGSIILLGALVGTRLLRRATAATRFAVWTSAMTGLALVAASRLLLPAMPMPSASAWLLAMRPPAWESVSATAAFSSAIANSNQRTERTPAQATAITPPNTPAGGLTSSSEASPTSSALSQDPTPAAMRATQAPVSTGAISRVPQWAVILLMLWVVGSVLVFLRFVRGTLSVAREVRAAPRSLDGAHWTLLQQLSETMQVQRPVALRLVDSEQIPVTTGIVHPVILLPRVALSWPRERVALVLQHELAHVARYDLAFATAAQVVLVLCWWHPLAWYAMHGMEQEREQACDDLVLANGVVATDYAEELLRLVRSLRTPAPAAFAALGMARASQVETRLRALLQPGRSRRPASRTVVTFATLGALALLPLGRIMPFAEAAQPPRVASGSARASSKSTRSSAESPATATASPKLSASVLADSVRANSGQADVATRALMTSERDTVARRVKATIDRGSSRSEAGVPATVLTPRDAAGKPELDPARALARSVNTDAFALGGVCPPIDHSVSIGRSKSDTLESYYRIDKTACVWFQLRGDVRLSDDDMLESLTGPSARLVVVHSDRQTTRRLTAWGDGGSPSITLTQDGANDVPLDRWSRQMYLQAARDMGLDAERRVSRLVRAGNADALLREIRNLRADDVIGRYYQLALANRQLRGSALIPLIAAAERFVDTQSDRNVQRQLHTSIDAARAR